MVSLPLSSLPPEARRAAEAVARAEGLLGRPRRRAGARMGPPPAPVLLGPPAALLSPGVAAWAWREHPRCGWAGIGPCLFCEGGG